MRFQYSRIPNRGLHFAYPYSQIHSHGFALKSIQRTTFSSRFQNRPQILDAHFRSSKNLKKCKNMKFCAVNCLQTTKSKSNAPRSHKITLWKYHIFIQSENHLNSCKNFQLIKFFLFVSFFNRQELTFLRRVHIWPKYPFRFRCFDIVQSAQFQAIH